MSEKIKTEGTDFDPSLGAYPMDHVQGIVPLDENGDPLDPTGTLAARGDGSTSFHSEETQIKSIFDQEDLRIPDEATGDTAKLVSEFEELEGVQVVDHTQLDLGREALVGLDPEDAAAKWLKANDPDSVDISTDQASESEEDL